MATTWHLKVEPLPDATFGAVITGVDLNNLNRATWADIETAFNEHGLLIFPAQHLTADTQAIFAKRFGSLEGGGPKGSDRARSISNRRSDRTALTERDPTWLKQSYPTRHWHTDGTFNPVPPKICLLTAVSVPSRGGQTAFADMSAAYDALDQATKDGIAGLNSYHSNLVGTTRVLPRPNQEVLSKLVGDAPQDGYLVLATAPMPRYGRW